MVFKDLSAGFFVGEGDEDAFLQATEKRRI
jgi:hypothetical protein